MHNQKRNTLLSAKTRLPSWLPDHIYFTDKNIKTHTLPRDISGPATAGHFSTSRYLGTRAKILTAKYSIGIFTHLKLGLDDAIHNFKWVKIIQIRQNECQRFWNIADWCHIYHMFKSIYHMLKSRYVMF